MKTKNDDKRISFKDVAKKFISAKKAKAEQYRLLQEKKARDEKARLQKFQQKMTALLVLANENLKRIISEEHGDRDFIAFLLNLLNQGVYRVHDDNMNLFGFGFDNDGPDRNDPILGRCVHVLVLNIYELETGPSTNQVLALAVRTERFNLCKIKKKSLQNAHFVMVQQHIHPRTDAVDYDQVSSGRLNMEFAGTLRKLTAVHSTYELFLKQFGHSVGL